MQFDQLGLLEPLLRAVQAEGYEQATPIQAKAIPEIIAGRDLIGSAQTGTGKTAAFALPTLQRLWSKNQAPNKNSNRAQRRKDRKIRALILSPTRELAGQIAKSFCTYGRFTGLRHTVVYGGVSQNPQVRALNKGVDTLIATPGRVLDLMNQGHVDVSGVEILIFDEADRMLDMGFIHDLRRIASKVPSRRQTLMFSATMPAAIRRLANQWLRDPIHVQVAQDAAPAEKIEQSVYFVEPKQKPLLLAGFLHRKCGARTLVFARTKRGADKIVRNLSRRGIRSAAIHGNKSQATRQRVLEQFRSDRLPVLVATDVAARGLDVDNISHVINYDMPHDPETYVHRIGRTGRAGASGIAVSFCGRDEHPRLRLIERLIRQSIAVEQQRFEAPTETEPSSAPSACPAAATRKTRPGRNKSRRRQGRPASKSRPTAARGKRKRPSARGVQKKTA